MCGFSYLKASMMSSHNSFGRTEILERSMSIAIIWGVVYIKTTAKEP